MAWEDFWKTVDGPYGWVDDGFGDLTWGPTKSTAWNTASGYASPEDYLVKTRGIPAWMAQFVDKARDGTDAYNRGTTGTLDAAGFVLPNAYGGQRGTGNGKFDLGWIPDDNGDFPQEAAFRAALQQQLAGQGSGFAMPLADVQKGYQNSNIPGAGYSFDQYLQKQYQNPQIVDVPGVGQVVTAGGVNTFDWGLSNDKGFLDSLIKEIIPAGLTMYGAMTGIGGLSDLLINGAGSVAGALGDTVTGVDSLADFNNLSMGDYTDLGGIMGSGGEIAAAMGNGIAPVSDAGMSVGDPFMDAFTPDLSPTLPSVPDVPIETGAFDQFGAINSPTGTGMPGTVQQVMGGGAAAGAGGALTSALNRALGLNLNDSDTALLGKLAGAGIGLLGANQTGSAMSSLADKYLNLGAPARARLEQSYADPGSYLNGPDMQAFLGQSAKQQANALSSRFGNPALSPNANQELLNSTANLASQGIYNYRNQLAAQGGLGIAPAAQFDAGGAQAGNTGFNIAASVLGDATNPQQSIIEQMRQLAKLGGGNFLMVG